jgi:release factor glutamine methyltransferase
LKNNDRTVIDVINRGTDYLKKHNISSPRLNIELLLCNLLNIDRISIYTNFDKPLKEEELAILREGLLRLKNSEPIDYVTGRRIFMDLELEVNPSVLIPRPETEMLITKARKIIPKEKKIEILDIGTGSGCIALQLAKEYPEAKVYAIDVMQESLNTAKNNAKKNNIENVGFKKTDILNEVIDYKFDYIFSNPPYIPTQEYLSLEKNVLEYEPETALNGGVDGLKFYKRFADIFKTILKKDGAFFLEIGAGQKESISQIFSEKRFKLQFEKDFSDIYRICIGNF